MKTPLEKPLTVEEIRERRVRVGCYYLQEVVKAEFDEIVGCTMEDIQNTLSNLLIGDSCLNDISYEFVGLYEDGFLIQVSGYPNTFLKQIEFKEKLAGERMPAQGDIVSILEGDYKGQKGIIANMLDSVNNPDYSPDPDDLYQIRLLEKSTTLIPLRYLKFVDEAKRLGHSIKIPILDTFTLPSLDKKLYSIAKLEIPTHDTTIDIQIGNSDFSLEISMQSNNKHAVSFYVSGDEVWSGEVEINPEPNPGDTTHESDE